MYINCISSMLATFVDGKRPRTRKRPELNGGRKQMVGEEFVICVCVCMFDRTRNR